MKRYKWLFWLPEERETSGHTLSSHADTEACREWTPFLTALFDGEANEDEALRARRHMIVCERCARAWLDWNQTRSLLINHSAPPPPPSLLWRIRLACRLGNPAPTASAEPAVPELSAQIFALTSRQNAKPKPAFSFASFFTLPRGLRLNSPFLGAMAMGAFVLFIGRSSLLVSSDALSPSEETVERAARVQPHSGPVLSAREKVDKSGVRSRIRAASPRAGEDAEETIESRELKVATPRRLDDGERRSQSTLERARRERESLASSPVRLVSYEPGKPLPMLAAPRPLPMPAVKPAPAPVRPVVRAPKLAELPRMAPRPVTSVPRSTMAPVMLASFDSSDSPVSASRARGASRAVLASTSSSAAPLRISAPHALPITVSQPPAPDDAGLDELDSTVLEYRAVLASDETIDPSFN